MNRGILKVLGPIAGAFLGLAVTSQRAVAADPCPPVGLITGCNIIITISAAGTASTSLGAGGTTPYDGVEDQLVGVINNFGANLFAIALSGSNLFGFDGDGVCTFLTCTYPHPTGYEGPGTSFTVANANTGTVNFLNGGLAANGGTAYFSLEEAPSVNGITINQITTTTPEPASLALMATGLVSLFGVGSWRRRRTGIE